MRYRFVKDGDGHNYLIPASKHEQFHEFVKAMENGRNYEGEGFDKYRIDGISRYTFENPVEDY